MSSPRDTDGDGTVSARAPVLILTLFLVVAFGLGIYHGIIDADFLSPMPETRPGAAITVP